MTNAAPKPAPERIPGRIGGPAPQSPAQKQKGHQMSEKRRALGRGLGALIPNSPAGEGAARPVDVFFKDNSAAHQARVVSAPERPREVSGTPAATDDATVLTGERDGMRDGVERDGAASTSVKTEQVEGSRERCRRTRRRARGWRRGPGPRTGR